VTARLDAQLQRAKAIPQAALSVFSLQSVHAGRLVR
jgi:hypothetical protein